MGLPGAGKTTLALNLIRSLHTQGRSVEWLNADDVRKQYNDWDFSTEGRLRQSQRMRELADQSSAEFVIADFIAPLPEMRETYSADYIIWVDTIKEGRFEDTNKLFVNPIDCNIKVRTQNAEYWTDIILKDLL
jgi:adenylylsulfate kinase